MVFTDSDASDDDDEIDDLDFPPPRINARSSPAASTSQNARGGCVKDTSSHSSSPLSGYTNGKNRRVSPAVYDTQDSSGSDDGQAAYKRWKEKSNIARTKAVKSARKAKARDVENNYALRARPSGATGVGVGAPKKKRRVKERIYGDSPSEEDELMEWTMPDYIKARRSIFDERRARLREGGLDLPPDFDGVYFSDNDRLNNLKERPNFPHLTPCAPYRDKELPYSLGLIPAPVAQYLREYQVEGAAFLHELFVYQKGGILGDDMGLGKTIQVIAFLTAAYGKTGDERDKKRMRKMRREEAKYPKTLIICPGSLMANWQEEFKRWGWWHVDLYHGSMTQKEAVLSQAQSGMLEIMITTYDTYRLSAGHINMVPWDCVIADECHKIKERKAETTKIINEVNALCRIGLTGTAIQNKYEELWTLLNWTNPGRLGPVSTWKVSVCEPLKLGQSHNATQYELARSRKTATLLVKNLLPQFFLRRTKELIKDQLPKKTDRVVFCPLTETQTDVYERFLESEIVQAIKNSSEPCSCGRLNRKQGWCCGMYLEDGRSWQSWVFPAINILRNLSNHLALLIPQSSDGKDKQAKDLEVLQSAMPDDWKRLYTERDSMLHTGNPEFCGKWRVLRKLLKFWYDQGDNKVLVFSHSVRLLRMLQSLFINTSYNIKYLDGSMNYEDRYAAVQSFNADPTQFVFLISTRAGGVGLNITSANKVVVVDPNWNPAYDLQAQDRAYRIGQTRDVEVFRLISQGTLEEIVYARQIYKQQQASIGYNASSERRYFQGVQDRKDQKGEIFGLQNLFAYQNENVVLRDIVNKTNVAESRADITIVSLDVAADEDITFKDEHDDLDQKTSCKTEPSEGDEDAAISQLAAEITGQSNRPKRRATTPFIARGSRSVKTKHDPIQAILSSVGVSYTHNNNEVIGSSRVEAQLSKMAEDAAAGNAAAWSTQDQQTRVFQSSQPEQIDDDGLGEGLRARNVYGSEWMDEEGNIKYKYRPPEDVRRRQFCSMAVWAGYGGEVEDVVEFALVVESWTQAERREVLDKFYRWRRNVLLGVGEGKNEEPPKGAEAGIKSETEDDEL